MPRVRTSFICSACAAVHPKWMGKCPDCGAWDSLEESRDVAGASADPHLGTAGEIWAGATEPPKAVPLAEATTGAPPARIATGMGEFDRVLGGGLVRGSVVLVGGDPGIGKSTLLLQSAGAMAASGARTLYVTSEESAEQVRLRARRLGVAGSETPDLYVLADTNLARVLEQARQVRPDVVIVDSIQMVYKADVEASPGSVAQLRRCCTELVYLAKAAGVAVVLVGHVTKDGALAGPRLLEHMVDAVLSFEGDRYHAHRVVRSAKNRFGATLEVGLFEMTGGGLREAPDGASAVVSADDPRPGSVLCPVLTGSRCVLVELQALTATGFLGSAKRKASGVDGNRLAMLIAVLEQHAGLRLADRDVFASAVGGVRVQEPAADLALALAIAGAHLRRTLPARTAAIGEIGLGGEARSVGHGEIRLREARRLGVSRILAPPGADLPRLKGLEVVRVRSIGAAIQDLS